MMDNSQAEQDCSITVQGVKCIPFEDNGIMTIDLRSAGFLKQSIPGELLLEEQKISRILLCHEDVFSFVESTICNLYSNIKNKTIDVFGECDKTNPSAQEFAGKYLWKTGHVNFNEHGGISIDLNCKSVKGRKLNFSSLTSFSEISLTGLQECFELKELYISGSKSCLKQPVILPKSANLREIRFVSCGLQQLPVGLDQCPQLHSLDLGGNEMLGQQPVVLPKLTKLKELGLDRCGLQQLPVGLDQCPQLELLGLGDNEMLGQQPVILPKLTSLKELRLNRCGLQQLPKGLEECSGLKNLSISGDAHVAIQLTHLCLKLPNLANLQYNYQEFVQHGAVWYKGVSSVWDLPGKVYLKLCDMFNYKNFEVSASFLGYSRLTISTFAKAGNRADVILSAWAGNKCWPEDLEELSYIMDLDSSPEFNEILESYGGSWAYPRFGRRHWEGKLGWFLQDSEKKEEQEKVKTTAKPGGSWAYPRFGRRHWEGKLENRTPFDLRPDIYESVCERLNAPFLVEDYNFLAEILGYTIGQASEFKLSGNPADAMLCDWASKPGKNLRQIIGILEAMERYDVAELLKKAETTSEKTGCMEFDEILHEIRAPTAEKTGSMEFDSEFKMLRYKIKEKMWMRRHHSHPVLWFPFTAYGFPFHGDSGEESRSSGFSKYSETYEEERDWMMAKSGKGTKLKEFVGGEERELRQIKDIALDTIYDLPPAVYKSVCLTLNESSVGKDFNVLAQHLGYSVPQAERLEQSSNPADAMLFHWATQEGHDLNTLIEILKKTGKNHVVEILTTQGKSIELKEYLGEEKRESIRKKGVDDTGEESSSIAEAKQTPSVYQPPPSLSITIPEFKDTQDLAPYENWKSVELPVDVILLALSDDGFLSCLPYLENAHRSRTGDLGFVYFGETADGHSKATIALLNCSSAPKDSHAFEDKARNAVKILQPKALFSVGFCSGLSSDEAKLGNVMVSPMFFNPAGDPLNFSQSMIDLTNAATAGWQPPLEDAKLSEVKVHHDKRNLSGDAAADFHPEIDWVKIEGIAYYTDVTQEPTKEWKRFASVMAASVTNTILKETEFLKNWTHNGRSDEREQKFSFTIDDKGGSVTFPSGCSFLQFPAQAVPKPVTITCRRIHTCPREPKNGDVFCSRIVHIEPEGLVFHKSVTILMFHSAFESGAYRDYYDVTVQQLEEEWNDLDTERISERIDLANLNVSDLNDVTRYLPLAKADITKTGTVVVATRISSEKFDVYHDELCVYPRSYGEESQLEILFPVGAVEEDCCLDVQVFPADRKKPEDDLICLPTIRVSGRDEDFLKPVKVELCYRTTAVASLDEEFLPIGKIFPFSSKYGVLLRSCDDSQAIETWENVSASTNATIERIEKDRLRIKFSVDHFSDISGKVTLCEDASVKSSQPCASQLPGVRVVCFAGLEKKDSFQRVTAMLGLITEKDEIRRLWGHDGSESYHPFPVGGTAYFCVPYGDGHLPLLGNNVSLLNKGLSMRRNRINSRYQILGEEMHFLYEKCVDGNHSEEHCFCECDIMSKQTTAQNARPGETLTASTSPSNDILQSDINTGKDEFHNSSDDKTTSDYRKNKALQIKKERCELFWKKVEEHCKELLEVDGDPKKSKIIKYVDDAGKLTAIACGIAGGALVIALGTATMGIPTLVGAGVATACFVVKKKDELKNAKIVRNVKEIKDNSLESLIISVVKEVGIEMSRIYEEQIFQMNDDDISTTACGAVNLMFESPKDEDKFSRNELLKKVLEGEVKKRKLKTKKHKKNWRFPAVFQKPGLREEIHLGEEIQFKYFERKQKNACKPEKYGYRGQILEVVKRSSNQVTQLEERNHNNSGPELSPGVCASCSRFLVENRDESTGDVEYFAESDIDARYTEERIEGSQYQPYHCLVQCPDILEKFAAVPNTPSQQTSWKGYVSKMYYRLERPIRPVYRPHSPKTILKLKELDLSGSDFSHVCFTKCDMGRCNLAWCTIFFGELGDARLCNANLKGAQLHCCNMERMKSHCCELTATKVFYPRVTETDKTDFRGAINFNDHNFIGVSMEDILTGSWNNDCESCVDGCGGRPQSSTRSCDDDVEDRGGGPRSTTESSDKYFDCLEEQPDSCTERSDKKSRA